MTDDDINRTISVLEQLAEGVVSPADRGTVGDALRCIKALKVERDTLWTTLFQASPHVANGAAGHPTDRQDARRILRAMKAVGIEP